ncbi:homodimeric glycerol 3-phosphate dehydrogenase (quinone) [Streptohalobacillus salinus]|uniref:Aerobic glycerol-3-phosphate dehydrogenase n=1 Tax=Streptohalobacillus salinus TaxID=621096 RepID=A0A2V3WAP4_9BACI|nr:FAD-dependent oxidoreductase [Streptohalobacillus salinus]PXW91473.1 homodimeric glycerol 3-phosphate dehydrogenase (quinone) [Streptohalobacillus salinus]
MAISNQNREELIRQLAKTHYDVIIVGGGITGARLLYDLQSRGMRVLLVEKNDFANNQSSQFEVIAEQEQLSGKEKKRFTQELQYLERNLPTRTNFMTFLNIHNRYGVTDSLTDRIKGTFKPRLHPTSKVLSRKEVVAEHPHLELTDDVKIEQVSVPVIDPVRITLDILKSAHEMGADVINYQKVTDFIYQDQMIRGVRLEDQMTGEEAVIQSRMVINATGRDINELHQLATFTNKNFIHFLSMRSGQWMIKKEALTLGCALSIQGDLQMYPITLVPMENVWVLTVKEPFHMGESAKYSTSESMFNRALDLITHRCPAFNVTYQDVFEGKSINQIDFSHHQKIANDMYVTDTGLISTLGVPFIYARSHAENIGDVVSKRFKKEAGILYQTSETKTRMIQKDISGTKLEINEQKDPRFWSVVDQLGLSLNEINKYQAKINQTAMTSMPEYLSLALLYTLEHEGIYKPTDFLFRRLRLVMVNTPLSLEEIDELFAFFTYHLAWTKEERSYYERDCRFWLKQLQVIQ